MTGDKVFPVEPAFLTVAGNGPPRYRRAAGSADTPASSRLAVGLQCVVIDPSFEPVR
jgi:hypothetical protein